MAKAPVFHPANKIPSAGTPVCGWKLERAARKCGFLRIAGCDEVGRGPMFGPVVAAAVILAPKCRLEGLDDSKKVPEKRRNDLDLQIRAQAVAWAIAAVDVETIDRINIRNASLLAMRTAVSQLALTPDYLLIDGCDTIDWPVPATIRHSRRWDQLLDCRRQHPGQGIPRSPAGGVGQPVSRLWTGQSQGLLLRGASRSPGAARPYAPAPQELEPGDADRARVFVHAGDRGRVGMRVRLAVALALPETFASPLYLPPR